MHQRMQKSRGIFLGLEPLIGNVIWSGVVWVAVDVICMVSWLRSSYSRFSMN